jgi:hypothetical protein
MNNASAHFSLLLSPSPPSALSQPDPSPSALSPP